jgi:ribosome biogenesis GTPase
MELSQLGWNEFFEQDFGEFRRRGCVPARIAREHKRLYLAYSELGEFSSGVSGRMRYSAGSKADLPAVGDWVALEPHQTEGSATIHGVLPRKSKFCRKVAWVRTEEQVLAANIDFAFLVSGLDRDFNVRRLERYLTLTWESGAKPVVVLNKSDVCENLEECIEEAESVALGVPVHAVSALAGSGLEPLRTYTACGSTVALLGSSGVGKSSIINSLIGEDLLKVGALRKGDGKGRHVTTTRELVLIPDGGSIIDTPGMRELQLWADERSLEGSFEDIEDLAAECRFRDCQHQTEPGCAVTAAIEGGTLDATRYRSYVKLRKELRILAVRKDQRARGDNKAGMKKIAKWSRQLKKFRRKN